MKLTIYHFSIYFYFFYKKIIAYSSSILFPTYRGGGGGVVSTEDLKGHVTGSVATVRIAIVWQAKKYVSDEEDCTCPPCWGYVGRFITSLIKNATTHVLHRNKSAGNNNKSRRKARFVIFHPVWLAFILTTS